MTPLIFADLGKEEMIKKIGGTVQTKKFLENLGFVVGSDVTVVNAVSGNIIVKVKDSRIAVSKEMAAKIMI